MGGTAHCASNNVDPQKMNIGDIRQCGSDDPLQEACGGFREMLSADMDELRKRTRESPIIAAKLEQHIGRIDFILLSALQKVDQLNGHLEISADYDMKMSVKSATSPGSRRSSIRNTLPSLSAAALKAATYAEAERRLENLVESGQAVTSVTAVSGVDQMEFEPEAEAVVTMPEKTPPETFDATSTPVAELPDEEADVREIEVNRHSSVRSSVVTASRHSIEGSSVATKKSTATDKTEYWQDPMAQEGRAL